MIANRILLALPRRAIEDLRPNLERVDLHRDQIIGQSDAAVEYVHFVNRGVALP